jgi:succinate-semialdehyde dehydrogenase / glutarate-semialdehyde dehydrogenase
MIATGQCCVGSKRIIIVGKKRGEKFLSDFCSAMANLRAGDPADSGTTLGPLATGKALQHLLSQITTAVDDGATLMTGGKQLPREGFFIEPTVITDISPSNRIFSQELFGPVAQFFVVDSVDEAISLANAVPYGLGASIFTDDLERAQNLARQIESGMVFVNQPSRTAPELPFGGVKSSGFGRELSELGINEFVNKKLVNLAPVGAPASGSVPFPQAPRMLA